MRRDLCDDRQPAMDIAFKGKHVRGAGSRRTFAWHFVGNSVPKKVLQQRVEELVDAVAPCLVAICLADVSISSQRSTGATHVVVHEGRALREDSGIVRKGCLVNVGAVVLHSAAVIDKPALGVNVSNAPEPVPCVLGIFGVCFVFGVSRQAGANVEEATVRNG